MQCDLSRLAQWLPALLQCADPLFPTGAYAHSFGLEEFVRLGGVQNEAGLVEFLRDQLLPLLERVELPYLRFCIEAANHIDDLCELDQEIDAWKLASESRLASCQIGIRRLSALKTISSDSRLSSYAGAVSEGHAHGHHLCACALQAAIQSTPLNAALLTYGYQTLAGACTAALKLIRIGQDACQRSLTAALCELPACVENSLLIKREDAGCFSPILEIAAMRHAFARERLFIS
jgi:urease accessory protein